MSFNSTSQGFNTSDELSIELFLGISTHYFPGEAPYMYNMHLLNMLLLPSWTFSLKMCPAECHSMAINDKANIGLRTTLMPSANKWLSGSIYYQGSVSCDFDKRMAMIWSRGIHSINFQPGILKVHLLYAVVRVMTHESWLCHHSSMTIKQYLNSWNYVSRSRQHLRKQIHIRWNFHICIIGSFLWWYAQYHDCKLLTKSMDFTYCLLVKL